MKVSGVAAMVALHASAAPAAVLTVDMGGSLQVDLRLVSAVFTGTSVEAWDQYWITVGDSDPGRQTSISHSLSGPIFDADLCGTMCNEWRDAALNVQTDSDDTGWAAPSITFTFAYDLMASAYAGITGGLWDGVASVAANAIVQYGPGSYTFITGGGVVGQEDLQAEASANDAVSASANRSGSFSVELAPESRYAFVLITEFVTTYDVAPAEPPAPVPVVPALPLLLAGIGGLALVRRRRSA